MNTKTRDKHIISIIAEYLVFRLRLLRDYN
jgi:hypothetical protein